MRMLAHDALIVARRIMVGVRAAHALARNGDHAQSRALLERLASEVAAELPVLDGVIAAQRQAAEMLNLTESPAVRVLCSIGKAAEQPHASNDKPHAPSPLQPSDGVA